MNLVNLTSSAFILLSCALSGSFASSSAHFESKLLSLMNDKESTNFMKYLFFDDKYGCEEYEAVINWLLQNPDQLSLLAGEETLLRLDALKADSIIDELFDFDDNCEFPFLERQVFLEKVVGSMDDKVLCMMTYAPDSNFKTLMINRLSVSKTVQPAMFIEGILRVERHPMFEDAEIRNMYLDSFSHSIERIDSNGMARLASALVTLAEYNEGLVNRQYSDPRQSLFEDFLDRIPFDFVEPLFIESGKDQALFDFLTIMMLSSPGADVELHVSDLCKMVAKLEMDVERFQKLIAHLLRSNSKILAALMEANSKNLPVMVIEPILQAVLHSDLHPDSFIVYMRIKDLIVRLEDALTQQKYRELYSRIYTFYDYDDVDDYFGSKASLVDLGISGEAPFMVPDCIPPELFHMIQPNPEKMIAVNQFTRTCPLLDTLTNPHNIFRIMCGGVENADFYADQAENLSELIFTPEEHLHLMAFLELVEFERHRRSASTEKANAFIKSCGEAAFDRNDEFEALNDEEEEEEEEEKTAPVKPKTDLTNSTKRQLFVMHLVAFEIGPFKGIQPAYRTALVAFCKMLFPMRMAELLAAKVCLNGDMSVESMFECPFIDKRWIFEYYGSLLVDHMHERSLSRILSNEELMVQLKDHIENSSDSLDWISILSNLVEKLERPKDGASIDPKLITKVKNMLDSLADF